MLISAIFAGLFYVISWIIQKLAKRNPNEAKEVNEIVFGFSFIALSIWDINHFTNIYLDAVDVYGNDLPQGYNDIFVRKLVPYLIVFIPILWFKKSSIIRSTKNLFKRLPRNIKEVKSGSISNNPQKIIFDDPSFESANEYIERIEKIKDNEDMQEEVIKLATISLKFEKSTAAYFYRSSAKWELGKNKGALKDITKAIELDPNPKKGLFYFRGILQIGNGNFEDAVSDFTKAIELDSNDSELFQLRGDSKIHLADYSGAIIDCKKAIELNPENSDAIAVIATAEFYLEDFENAIKNARKAIKFDPNNQFAFYYSAYSKYRLEDFSGALKDINKAIKIDPEDDKYHNLKGYLKKELEDYDQAIKAFSKAIKLNPEDSDNYRGMGQAKLLIEDLEGAKLDFSKAGELGDDEAKEWSEDLN